MGDGPFPVGCPPANGCSQRWILTLGTLTTGCDVPGSPGAGAARVQRMTLRCHGGCSFLATRARPSLIDSGCGTDRSAVMGEVTLCLLGRAREKRSLYLLQIVSRENKRDVGPQVGHSHAGCNQPETLGMKRVGLGEHHRLLQAVPREGRRYEKKGK
jgi:hypothetical protein